MLCGYGLDRLLVVDFLMCDGYGGRLFGWEELQKINCSLSNHAKTGFIMLGT